MKKDILKILVFRWCSTQDPSGLPNPPFPYTNPPPIFFLATLLDNNIDIDVAILLLSWTSCSHVTRGGEWIDVYFGSKGIRCITKNSVFLIIVRATYKMLKVDLIKD